MNEDVKTEKMSPSIFFSHTISWIWRKVSLNHYSTELVISHLQKQSLKWREFIWNSISVTFHIAFKTICFIVMIIINRRTVNASRFTQSRNNESVLNIIPYIPWRKNESVLDNHSTTKWKSFSLRFFRVE